MTRDQFVARAVRGVEKAIAVPAGWWGTFTDVRSPRGVRVHVRGVRWLVTGRALPTEGFDLRSDAMRAARRRERS